MSADPQQAKPRRARWKWPATAVVLIVVAILVWIGMVKIINSGSGRTFTTAEQRAAPRCVEEDKVKAWILAKSGVDPASITFIEWGPHDLHGEISLNWPDAQSKKQLVRAVYRASNITTDAVFLLRDGAVFTIFLVDGGNDWLKKLRDSRSKK